jgi:hypothetical protein
LDERRRLAAAAAMRRMLGGTVGACDAADAPPLQQQQQQQQQQQLAQLEAEQPGPDIVDLLDSPMEGQENTASGAVQCPVCSGWFAARRIQVHVDACLGGIAAQGPHE